MLVRYRTGRIRAFKGSDQVSKAVEAARVVHPSTITHTRQTYGRVIPLGFSSTRHCLVKPGRKVRSRTANGWQVAKASGAEATPAYTRATSWVSCAARVSLAVFSARRINGSSVSFDRVMSLLQLLQLTWKPSRTRLAFSRNMRVQPGHLIFTLSSVTTAKPFG